MILGESVNMHAFSWFIMWSAQYSRPPQMVSTHQKPRFSAASIHFGGESVGILGISNIRYHYHAKKKLVDMSLYHIPIDGKRWNSLLKKTHPELDMEPKIRVRKTRFLLIMASLGFHVKWCRGLKEHINRNCNHHQCHPARFADQTPWCRPVGYKVPGPGPTCSSGAPSYRF